MPDSGRVCSTFGWGAGLHLQLGFQEVFLEYQRYSRGGGLESLHGYSAGLILAWPFFRRVAAQSARP
jgi:hypothetical protein